MNERIQELIEQSKCLSDGYNTGAIDLEKFVKLIVKECVEISDVGSITEDKIYKHFGAEE